MTNKNDDYKQQPHEKLIFVGISFRRLNNPTFGFEREKVTNEYDDYRQKPHEKATKFRRYKFPSV